MFIFGNVCKYFLDLNENVLKTYTSLFCLFCLQKFGFIVFKMFLFNKLFLFILGFINQPRALRKEIFKGILFFTEAFHKKIARTTLKKSEIRIFSNVYILRTRQVMFSSYFNIFSHFTPIIFDPCRWK